MGQKTGTQVDETICVPVSVLKLDGSFVFLHVLCREAFQRLLHHRADYL